MPESADKLNQLFGSADIEGDPLRIPGRRSIKIRLGGGLTGIWRTNAIKNTLRRSEITARPSISPLCPYSPGLRVLAAYSLRCIASVRRDALGSAIICGTRLQHRRRSQQAEILGPIGPERHVIAEGYKLLM